MKGCIPQLSCAFMLVLCSCGRLSHSTAKSLIERAPEFSGPKEASFKTGSVIFSVLDPIYPALHSLKMIKVTNAHPGLPITTSMFNGTVEITGADLDRKEWKKGTVETCCAAWTVPLATRSVSAIIGIREVRSDTRQVEFRWKWNLTRFGTAVVQLRPEIEKLHTALLEQIRKEIRVTEEYERAHRVLLVGKDVNLSFALKSIDEDYQRQLSSCLVDDLKEFRSVATLHRLDTGWQFEEPDARKLLESLEKAEEAKK